MVFEIGPCRLRAPPRFRPSDELGFVEGGFAPVFAAPGRPKNAVKKPAVRAEFHRREDPFSVEFVALRPQFPQEARSDLSLARSSGGPFRARSEPRATLSFGPISLGIMPFAPPFRGRDRLCAAPGGSGNPALRNRRDEVELFRTDRRSRSTGRFAAASSRCGCRKCGDGTPAGAAGFPRSAATAARDGEGVQAGPRKRSESAW